MYNEWGNLIYNSNKEDKIPRHGLWSQTKNTPTRHKKSYMNKRYMYHLQVPGYDGSILQM